MDNDLNQNLIRRNPVANLWKRSKFLSIFLVINIFTCVPLIIAIFQFYYATTLNKIVLAWMISYKCISLLKIFYRYLSIINPEDIELHDSYLDFKTLHIIINFLGYMLSIYLGIHHRINNPFIYTFLAYLGESNIIYIIIIMTGALALMSTPFIDYRDTNRRFHQDNNGETGSPNEIHITMSYDQVIEGLDVNNYKASSDDEDNECSICLCEYQEDEVVAKLPCGHQFHRKCVASWLRNHNTCPHCRKSFLKIISDEILYYS